MFAQRTNWNLSRNRFAEAMEAARSRGAEWFDLTASNPTTIGLAYDEATILKALANPRGMAYEPASKGMLVGREAVADYYAERGIACDPEHVVLTVSTSEAYSYCFRLLCDPGDEVLVPAPSYPLFEFLADIQDVHLVPYELVYDHGWQIEFESLRQAITPRSRAVMVVHPNNPTGHYTRQWEVDRLNALCAEHELAIVADEVFLDYALEQGQHLSFAENRGALTFTLSGLSKISGLPQMKAAWIVASGPEQLTKDAMGRLEVIADTYLSPNAPMQWALPELLASRKGIQEQLRQRVETNLLELDRQLAQQHSVTRLRVEGGWYAVLRVPVTRTDEELAIELMERESVLVHPGHFFNFSGDGFLVASLIVPVEEFCTGMERILRHLRSDSGFIMENAKSPETGGQMSETNIMTDFYSLNVDDGTAMQAYVARPDDDAVHPGLIVIQEAFGVNVHIRDVAERLARQGYVAIAPEMFHRTAEPGFEGSYTDFAAMMPHMQAMTIKGSEMDLQAAYEWLKSKSFVDHARLGAVGFCMGGRMAFLANTFLPLRAAVSFYGGNIPAMLDRVAGIQAPMLFFWGEMDKHIGVEQRQQVLQAMKASGKQYTNVEFSYADHGFFCDVRASYQPEAARMAWLLTVDFLKMHMGVEAGQ